MGKIKNACGISQKVRSEVLERDGGRCVICGSKDIQIAHYISRGRLGLGNPKNLACLCVTHHFEYDNGKFHNKIKELFKAYLKEHYPDWDEKELIYSKWK